MYLLYARAVLSFLFAPGLLGLAFGVGYGLGGYGIANTRRWGYMLAVAVSGLALVPYLVILLTNGIVDLVNVGFLLSAVFPVALFVLLVHPMSREHQRIYFD